MNDFIYEHIVYDDGWMWSGFDQGYVQMFDLSEEWIYDSKGDDNTPDDEKGIEISVGEDRNAIEMSVNGLRITINL